MSNVTIFKNQTGVSTRGLSELAKSLSQGGVTTRKIQTNTNGTFKRIVNGEVIGKAVRGEINVIIVDLLSKVSRTYYEGKYDPEAPPTLPNCWSNLGDKPEEAASDKQHTNCADCPMNIKGSGENGSRACRFQRRIAVLVEGDESGDVYQFNVPAKSLFGKGSGNVHPFESYIKYLLANGESPDGVVTNIKFDDEADTMALLFTPMRGITDEEYELVKQAQANPQTKRYTILTVAQADGVTKKPEKLAAPEKKVEAKVKVARTAEPEDEDDVPPPVKREVKRAQNAVPDKAAKSADLADVMKAWTDEE
jgi:hypothetical protein